MAVALNRHWEHNVFMDFSDLNLDRQDGQPIYLRLAAAIVAAIGRGELVAGEKLPSERELALRLGVSRTTVVGAYRELESRGLVRGQVGRGTFVSAAGARAPGDGPHPVTAPFAWQGKMSLGSRRAVDPTLRTMVRHKEPSLISFAGGVPALDRFPTAAYRRLTDRILRRGVRETLGLLPSEGAPELRRALAARCEARPEEILVTSGAQQALDLISRCLLDPGDAVVMDRPGYVGALETFRAAGASIVGWCFERSDTGELEDLILRYRPKLLYTNPTFQNPTGRTLSPATRREILRLASRYRLPVVEDTAYSELHFFNPAPDSLYQLDREGLVVRVGSFSKTLGAGLRLGWMVAPEDIVDQLSLIKARSDLFTAGPAQMVVADMLSSALYDDHLQDLRIEHRQRHEAMANALRRYVPAGTLSWRPAEGGLYLWCRLAPGLDARTLMQEATASGVTFVNGEPFYGDGTGKSHLRLCFSSTAPEQIEEGVRRLAEAIAEKRAGRAGTSHLGTQPLV
jgi:DNA-binding transcriptional MocR family regulator